MPSMITVLNVEVKCSKPLVDRWLFGSFQVPD